VARWSNGQWQTVGNGDELFGVNSFAVYDDGNGPALYAAAFDLMRWGGVQWTEVAGQPSSVHSAIGVHDSGAGPELIVSGGFTMQTETGWTEYIARFNGAQWLSMDGGLISVAHDYASFDDGSGTKLFAVGSFGFFDGGPAQLGIARWDGNSWSDVGGSANSSANAAVVFDDGDGPALYVGGNFTSVGGMSANFIARWDGTQWTTLGTGVNNAVQALAVFDDGSGPALYAGGAFTEAGGLSAHHIARWDGASWSAVGAGTNDTVLALHVAEHAGVPTLVVAGQFTQANGEPADRIALYGCPAAQPGDLDGNGVVDVFDLLELLGAWGPCDGSSCPADLNSSGAVDVFDLLDLLTAWG